MSPFSRKTALPLPARCTRDPVPASVAAVKRVRGVVFQTVSVDDNFYTTAAIEEIAFFFES